MLTNEELKELGDIAREVADEALNEVYGYGLSVDPGSFGYIANQYSSSFVLNAALNGCEDLENLAAFAHQGWAQAHYDHPQEGASQEKLDARTKLADTPYFNLSETEKEKDRVVAKAVYACTPRASQMYLWADPSSEAGTCYTIATRFELLMSYNWDVSKVDDLLVTSFASQLTEEQAKTLLAALAV